MLAINFEYDGQYLGDFGFIICDFDTSNTETISAGSKISFNKVSTHSGRKFSLVSAVYDECLEGTFDICKNPDIYDDMEITNDEYRDLMRWLNRKEFLKFQLLDCEKTGRDACFFNASFNIEKIIVSGKLCGLSLTANTDRPFGYGQEYVSKYKFSNANNSKILNDISDEIGSICPDIDIYCESDGDVSIYNEFTDCEMVIANCSKGETITIDGEAQIIKTDKPSHDICNDFNYEFLRIGNSYTNRSNKIKVSLPCTMTIKYKPIIKDSI